MKARNIRIGYTPDILTDAVADLTVMLILMAGRNAGETISLVQNGDVSLRPLTGRRKHPYTRRYAQWPKNTWNMFGFCGPQLSPSPFRPTRTVGFLGFGRIAQATLARLVPFGVQRCLFSANPSSAPDPQFEASTAARLRLRELRRVPRDELARESDVVVVLAPGGAQTHHIVDEAFLCAMKSDAVLVNTSRGTLVDSDALARALREKWIWGAGLDVVEGEPHIGADHPLVKEPRCVPVSLILRRLGWTDVRRRRCVILPHIGSATNETRLGMAELAANNVIGGVTGGQMPTELKL